MSVALEGLVERFRSTRSEEDFRHLHQRAGPRLFRLALRLTGWRRAEAEDLAQETWLRACRHLDRFRGDARFTTWLGGIAVNAHRERSRQGGPRPVDDPGRLDRAIPPADPATLDLEHAVARLGDRARRILVLHDVEGWTHAQIAAALEIAEGTSKRQLHDARRRLRAFLTETDHGTD